MRQVGKFIIQNFAPFFLAGCAGCIVFISGNQNNISGRTFITSLIFVILSVLLLIVEFVTIHSQKGDGKELGFKEFRILLITTSLIMVGKELTQANQVFSPLIYFIMLYAGTFSGIFTIAQTGIFSILLRWLEAAGSKFNQTEVISAITFTIFIILFGSFGMLFLRFEIKKLRLSAKKAMESYYQNLTETARAFRFISMPSGEPLQSVKEEKKARILSIYSAIEETRGNIFILLETLRKGLRLHSCLVLWLEPDGKNLKLMEGSTISENLRRGNIPAEYGITGIVLKHGTPVNFCQVQPLQRQIPYYETHEPVCSVCIVPIKEEEITRGVLCADRLTHDPFTEDEEKLIMLVAGQIGRIVQTERTILAIAKSRDEQNKLFMVASHLRNAVREEQVAEVLFNSTQEIIQVDFIALVTFDPFKKEHQIAFATGKGAEDLRGYTFGENEGLVSQVVKLAHALPWKGEFDPHSQIVFTRKTKLTGMRSLLIIPMVAGEKAIGSVVFSTQREKAFTSEKKRILQAIVDQTAVAFQNARNLQILEKTASTDPLTGLFNRRVFMEALGREFKSAKRFGRSMAIIMTDIDHFKSINDTYGHSTGDMVLKMFADVLRDNARQVDLVARWGGEEFIIMCKETGREGAINAAERIRQDIEKRSLPVENSKIVKVTCSLGVAVFPEDASTIENLIEKADEHLYSAKKSGRNRVVWGGASLLKKAV